MNSQELAINKLKEISRNLSNVQYDDIKDLIRNSIRNVPITSAILRKDSYIDRVRPNENNSLFLCEDQISYIKDPNIIKNRLTEFGRANKPYQVMFYGAVESSQIKEQRVTAILESSKIIKDINSVNIEGELLTLSRWKILEDILIAEIVFSDKAIAINQDTKKAFEHHLKQILNHPLREIGLLALQFFSDEFSKEVVNNADYKVSVAYANLMLTDNKITIKDKTIEGIAYPSVPSNFQGQNIVLTPDVVDKKLKLQLCTTHLLHKNKQKMYVNNHMYVNKLGINNSHFEWENVDPKHRLPLEDVIKYHLT